LLQAERDLFGLDLYDIAGPKGIGVEIPRNMLPKGDETPAGALSESSMISEKSGFGVAVKRMKGSE